MATGDVLNLKVYISKNHTLDIPLNRSIYLKPQLSTSPVRSLPSSIVQSNSSCVTITKQSKLKSTLTKQSKFKASVTNG